MSVWGEATYILNEIKNLITSTGKIRNKIDTWKPDPVYNSIDGSASVATGKQITGFQTKTIDISKLTNGYKFLSQDSFFVGMKNFVTTVNGHPGVFTGLRKADIRLEWSYNNSNGILTIKMNYILDTNCNFYSADIEIYGDI